MIYSIDLSKLRNADFIQFHKDFGTIVNRNNPVTLLVKPQYDALLSNIGGLDNLFQTVSANPITAELEGLDHHRDRAINGIAAQLKSFANHYDPAKVQRAAILQNNLDLYGNDIARQTYQRETALINSLVADWQTKPELIDAVDALGLVEWTTELKMINEEFGEKYIDRTQDYGAASPEKIKDKRIETINAYYALRNRLQARAEIEGTPLYTTTNNELNALITQYNTTLRGRTASTTEPATPV